MNSEIREKKHGSDNNCFELKYTSVISSVLLGSFIRQTDGTPIHLVRDASNVKAISSHILRNRSPGFENLPAHLG
jgi:hypothetical protein